MTVPGIRCTPGLAAPAASPGLSMNVSGLDTPAATANTAFGSLIGQTLDGPHPGRIR
jgi:hypothetical protein